MNEQYREQKHWRKDKDSYPEVISHPWNKSEETLFSSLDKVCFNCSSERWYPSSSYSSLQHVTLCIKFSLTQVSCRWICLRTFLSPSLSQNGKKRDHVLFVKSLIERPTETRDKEGWVRVIERFSTENITRDCTWYSMCISSPSRSDNDRKGKSCYLDVEKERERILIEQERRSVFSRRHVQFVSVSRLISTWCQPRISFSELKRKEKDDAIKTGYSLEERLSLSEWWKKRRPDADTAISRFQKRRVSRLKRRFNGRGFKNRQQETKQREDSERIKQEKTFSFVDSSERTWVLHPPTLGVCLSLIGS